MKKNKTVGLVVGKFLPPHKGHEALFRFAKELVDELIISVDCIENEPWSSVERAKWIEELFPNSNVKVIPITTPMPQEPSEREDFYPIWKKTLEEQCLIATGQKINVVIASMEYGVKLAEVLDSQFIEFDIARKSLPISATMIRNDQSRYWDYLIKPAQVELLKKFCFVGPESTGKTTLAIKMAEEFNTVYVPEYAKTLIDRNNGNLNYSDIPIIAKCQMASEKSLSYSANRAIICDTDLITTKLWSQKLFNQYPKWIDQEIEKHNYEYFLFHHDVPFHPDTHRKLLTDPSNEKTRQWFFDHFEELLKLHNKNYTIISGSYQERNEQVKNIIKKRLAYKPVQKLNI